MTVSLVSGVGVSRDSKDAWNDEEMRSKFVSNHKGATSASFPARSVLSSHLEKHLLQSLHLQLASQIRSVQTRVARAAFTSIPLNRSYFVAAQSALESFPDFSFCLIADD